MSATHWNPPTRRERVSLRGIYRKTPESGGVYVRIIGLTVPGLPTHWSCRVEYSGTVIRRDLRDAKDAEDAKASAGSLAAFLYEYIADRERPT